MIKNELQRIADALERMAPARLSPPDFTVADVFVWSAMPAALKPVLSPQFLGLELLVGIDAVRDRLLANTERFAAGLPANNALLWGARGMGKSSLVKAVYQHVQTANCTVKLIEIQRDDLWLLTNLLEVLRDFRWRFILFCDDLSFEENNAAYKSLKTVLDGGVRGRSQNIVLYATSNRRHLMVSDMIENEAATAVFATETTEEKVSLSDRFGLWLGFYPCDQKQYLAMIRGYCRAYKIEITEAILRDEAIAWQQERGSRSGRIAWQYFCDLAARRGVTLVHY